MSCESCPLKKRLSDYLNPDKRGLTVTAEVRDFVRVLLNIKPCETEAKDGNS